jgi:hypothetical protein
MVDGAHDAHKPGAVGRQATVVFHNDTDIPCGGKLGEPPQAVRG